MATQLNNPRHVRGILVILLLVFGALAGTIQAQEAPVEITVWFGRADFIPADRFDAFHEQYPHIRVTTDVIPLEQALTDFIRTSQAGQAPDILQVVGEFMAPLAIQGMLYDMTDLLETWREEDPANYEGIAPVAWEMASWDGVPYGIALHSSPYLYVYRLDLFEEAGIPHPPETWDDVVDAGRQLRTADRVGFSLVGSRQSFPSWFLGTFSAMGGEWIDGMPQLDSDAGIYTLGFYQTMMRENIAHPETLSWTPGDMRAAFISGNAAQAFIAPNIYPTIQAALPHGEVWAVAMPRRPGDEDEQRIMTKGWPYIMSAATEHPYEASLVLRYLATPEIVKEVATRYQPTTVLAVAEDPEYRAARPWEDAIAPLLENVVPLPPHPRENQVLEIVLDAMQEALSNPDADPAGIAARHQARLNALEE